jgi:hypothetical protein
MQMNAKATDSLSIIEDCLEKIYQARRANLLNKSRKFKEKAARRQFETPAYVHTKSAAVVDDNDLSEYADKEVIEELAVKYRAPPVVAKPYVKEQSHVAKEYQDQDASALRLFYTFCGDIEELIEGSQNLLPEDDFRADQCDILIEKYLTNHFDKMMPSRQLSKIRKHATHIIEEFASKNDPPRILELMALAKDDCSGRGKARAAAVKDASDHEDEPVQNSTLRQGGAGKKDSEQTSTVGAKGVAGASTRQGNGSAGAVAGNASANAQRSSTQQQPMPQQVQQPEKLQQPVSAAAMAVVPSAAERKKQDQARIKAQYEQLMNIKKKADNHPDDETINQYSALHADIQSVIDSIQKKQPLK